MDDLLLAAQAAERGE
jgi:hypothetical protein